MKHPALKAILWAPLALFALAGPLGAAGKEATIQKHIVLYDGSKGDPYTLMFPLELKRPGLIDVNVLIKDLTPDPKERKFEPLRVILIDARAFKSIKPEEWRQWLAKANKFNPLEWVAGDEIRSFVKGVKHIFGKKEKPPKYFHGQMACGRERFGESLRHAVDDPELAVTGGRYVVLVRNIADLQATGNLVIKYPGDVSELDPEAEEQALVKPDLTVEDVSLDARGQVFVRVANVGKAGVPAQKWDQKGPEAVSLLLEVEGRNYGVTLARLDPEHRLAQPGGRVGYVFERPLLAEGGRVTVTIDPTDKLAEANERNNRRIEKLEPRRERHQR